ncbi:DUF58 domain-containing protein [Virgibacillus sp. CBA3643]|uniref:DUF58 domain-containing protein n=1 Tax=Virgibacillus sp. CBA3643 TaxID=2942278 RepID=UPI0035A28839
MTKLLKNLWARFLFQDRGILPTRKLLAFFLIFSIAIIVISAFLGFSWLWLSIINGIILVMSLIDLSFSPKSQEVTAQRRMSSEMERGITYTVHIELSNTSAYAMNVRLKDGLPQSFQAPFPLKGNVKKQETAILAYNVVAPFRGKYDVTKLYIRYQSVFGLWEKQMAIELEDTIKVIPDLTETKQYLKSAQQFLLAEGSKIRRQGDSTGEFTQIRNYVVGDDPRKINWRQTAKLQTFMTNEYEPEHVQQAMIKSMAQQQILTKKREKAKWERQGLFLVETEEEQLATTAVSRYIDIMNQGLL